MTHPLHEALFHQCTWCGKSIEADEDYYGFGASSNPDIDLEEKAGQFVSLNLSLLNKTVAAFVPGESGSQQLGGHDLVFITCSEDCASSLKEALDLERDVFEDDVDY